MTVSQSNSIDEVVASIQKRWGAKALQKLKHVSRRTGISTGYATLDNVLGTEGVSRGALTCLSGQPTSGKVSLALSIIAQAQTENEIAVYIDTAQALDAESAEQRGVDLTQLLIVWPESPIVGLSITRDIIQSGGAGVIVLDTGNGLCPGETEPILRQLRAALRQSAYALVCLSPDLSGWLADRSDVQLQLKRQRWLTRKKQVTGYEIEISVERSRFVAPGQTVILQMMLTVDLPESKP